MLRTPFGLGDLTPPGGAVPNLEVVVDARDDDVAAELRVFHQSGGDTDPALLVELPFDSAGVEEAPELTGLAAELVEQVESRLDRAHPLGAGIRVQASVHAAAHDDSVPEGLPELGRQGEAVLVVDRMVVFTEE